MDVVAAQHGELLALAGVPQLCVDVVVAGLAANGGVERYRTQLVHDAITDLATVDDSAIDLFDLVAVQRIVENSTMTVRMDGGKDRTVTFDPAEMRHFDHGYAVTSHSSQGLTSERVLVNMDTNVHPDLINDRFAYVSVSRASQDAQIFTNAVSSLATSLGHAVDKTSAVSLETSLGV